MDRKRTFQVHYNGCSEIDNADAKEIFKQAYSQLVTEVFNIQANNDLLTIIYGFSFNETEKEDLKLKPITPSQWANKFVDLCMKRENVGACLNILCNLHKHGLSNYQAKIVKVLNDVCDVEVKEVTSDASSNLQNQKNCTPVNSKSMESNLEKNLVKFVEDTECDDVFLTHLQPIFSKSDISTLKTLRDSKNMMAANAKLYDLIRTRVGWVEHLQTALRETKQTILLELLEHGE